MDKSVLITGATSGIGFESARQIAAMGADVIGVGSSQTSCDKASNRMASYGCKVDYIACDLSDQESVRAMAANIKSRFNRLNVLINNAGVIYLKRKTDSNGIEKMFSVNYLSHYLLTRLLFDELLAAPRARIINVSSIAHKKVRMDFDDLNSSKSYRTMKVYGKTKLAQLLFTKYLSEKVDVDKITVNAMHPGVIPTNLISKNGILGTALTKIWKLIGTSPKDGAETIVYLANSDTVENVTGKYFVKCEQIELAPHAKEQVSAQMLWDKSSEMCTLPRELEL